MESKTLTSVDSLTDQDCEALALELWQAVLQQDTDKVRHLLERGTDPNHPIYWSKDSLEQQQKPPLHTACFLGDLQIVKSLIKYGADSEKGDLNNGKSALHHASMWGHKKVIECLVGEMKCRIDLTDKWGNTPLDLALFNIYGNQDCVEVAHYLINIGGASTVDKSQLLFGACRWGRLDIVKKLVEQHKIDPNDVVDEVGRSPLNKAIDLLSTLKPCVDVALYLIRRGCGSDEDKAKLLCGACRWGNLKAARELVDEFRVDPNCTEDEYCSTPLLMACLGRNKALVKYLVQDVKCNTDVRDRINRSALHYACGGGDKDIVQYLIEELKCVIDVRDMDNQTPLHIACANGHKEVVECLTEKTQCDINLKDIHDQTPLHVACAKGQESVVKYLVEKARCDSSVLDKKGKTPLDLASSRGYFNVVEYLKSRDQDCVDASGADLSSSGAIMTSLTQEDTEALHRLLQGKAVKVAQDPDKSNHITLEEVQQLLREKGHGELAATLRDKLHKVIGEQKQYLKRLEDLMTDEDTTFVCYLKVFLLGPPFVGKTTTLNRLLQEFENISTAGDKAKLRSTLLANCTQVLACAKDDGTKWMSSKDAGEETILLFHYLCGGKPEDSASNEERAPPVKTRSTRETLQVADEKEAIHDGDQPKYEEAKKIHQQSSSLLQRKASTRQRKKLAIIKSRLQKVIKTGDYSGLFNIMGSTLLNINDIGGQPGFLEMLPALSMGPAMYLIFLNLSQELNQRYEIPFSRDQTIITPYKAIHTVEDTLSQILSSIASVHCISREPIPFNIERAVDFSEKFEKFQKVRPIAALIGTHLDKLEDSEEKLQHVNEVLGKITEKYSAILTTPGLVKQPDRKESKALFFPVNNFSGTEQSDIAPIRDFMSRMFRTHFKEASLPIRKKWLLFGIILRREYCIVSMEDCIEIGMLLDMDEGEVRFCLWYLHHCIGTLMYYSEIRGDDDGWFKSHVICSPQVIFDSISQMILASLRILHSDCPMLECDRRDWIEKGQFSLESIEKYCAVADASKLIPAKKLVLLLEQVNLLSPIIHVDSTDSESQIKYLMPAVLECAAESELRCTPTPDANNPEPLHITFDCGYVPTGTFCGLITRLVSLGPSGILGFRWDLVEEGVKRNRVSFYVAKVNVVTLLSHERCYEIRVTRNLNRMSLHDLCTYILSSILYILKTLYNDLSPRVAFSCPCPAHESSRDINNLCILNEDYWIQFLCGRKSVTLRKDQKVWLEKHVTLGDCADLEVLQYAEEDFSFHWAKEGSKRPINPTDTPNTLSFQSVSEKDLGYYRCEVKEAGKMVFTAYRGLYRNNSAPSLPVPTSTASDSAQQDSDSQCGPTRSLVKLRRALWEVRAKWEDLTIELGLSAGTRTAIKKDHEGVGDRFTTLLEVWLREDPQLDDLLEALRSPVLEQGRVADELEEKIKTGKLVLWK